MTAPRPRHRSASLLSRPAVHRGRTSPACVKSHQHLGWDATAESVREQLCCSSKDRHIGGMHLIYVHWGLCACDHSSIMLVAACPRLESAAAACMAGCPSRACSLPEGGGMPSSACQDVLNRHATAVPGCISVQQGYHMRSFTGLTLRRYRDWTSKHVATKLDDVFAVHQFSCTAECCQVSPMGNSAVGNPWATC